MSRLAIGSDDFPLAAGKHLTDAQVLAGSSRTDGSVYLCGYVVECSLKALWIFQTGVPTHRPPQWRGLGGHSLKGLHDWVATMGSMAGSRVARYIGPAFEALPTTVTLATWAPDLRYRASGGVGTGLASQSLAEAEALFGEVVGQMQLDGEL